MMQEGELWAFDNKAEHDARNPTVAPRVHLIFDVLPPPGRGLLRPAAARLMSARSILTAAARRVSGRVDANRVVVGFGSQRTHDAIGS